MFYQRFKLHHMYTQKTLIRPKSKITLLDEYIKDGEKVFRLDINKIGYRDADKTIYEYCLKHNIKMEKINPLLWIKV